MLFNAKDSACNLYHKFCTFMHSVRILPHTVTPSLSKEGTEPFYSDLARQHYAMVLQLVQCVADQLCRCCSSCSVLQFSFAGVAARADLKSRFSVTDLYFSKIESRPHAISTHTNTLSAKMVQIHCSIYGSRMTATACARVRLRTRLFYRHV